MRRRLPNRRPSEIVSFVHDGIRCHGGVSEFGDGRPAEVFLDAGKPGSAVQAASRDAAVVASIALQHGASSEEIRGALTRLDDGAAAGPLGALMDLVAEGRSA